MKLLYVTYYDTGNVREWSGIPHHMLQAARRVFDEVEVVGPHHVPFRFCNKALRKIYGEWLKRGYVCEVQESFLYDYARTVEKSLSRTSGDLIFTDSLFCVARLQTSLPVVLWGDATYKCLREHYYGETEEDGSISIRASDEAQRAALHRCSLDIFASQWGADSAVNDYGIPKDKARVIPFGANLSDPPTREKVVERIKGRSFKPCRLLLVGVDWERKGAEEAIGVLQRLRGEGIDAELTIAGCFPKSGRNIPDHVRVTGFINKQTPGGSVLLQELWEQNDFHLFPSRAEAFGIVACEASAYGIPTLASDVGGITDAVRNGKNGYTYPLQDYVVQAAEKIKSLVLNPSEYQSIAVSSRREFEEELNWEKGFMKIKDWFQKTHKNS